jgi:hypothetical protein
MELLVILKVLKSILLKEKKIMAKVNSIQTIISAVLVLFITANSSFAQDNKLTKEVQVVRPYEPTISDAFKLNQLPQIEDTIRIVPTFVYNLALRPVSMEFPVNPIPAARMVAEPLSRISKGYAKLGFGNFAMPLAEVYFTNERSKDYSYGGWFQHKSSFSKVKLDNNDRVDAAFSVTNFSLFGKRIFDKSVLDTRASFNRFGYGFYGNDAPVLPTEVDDQAQQKINIGVSYYSTHSDSTHLNYYLRTNFSNFTDKFDMQQNSFSIAANFDKFFNIEKIGGSIELIHHMNNANLAPANNSIFSFGPWIGFYGKQWRAKAGVNATLDFNEIGTQANFYPIAMLSYDIISNYVIPYFQFSGYLENNSYSKIMAENPWIQPGLNVWNTSHKFIMKGGVKGNLSPRVAYNVSAKYSLIDSAYFFVNPVDPTNTFLENRFDVALDNIQFKQFSGELTIAPTSKIKLFFQAEFNIYTMQDLDKPWHKPNFIGRSLISYNIQDKILLKSTIFYEGKRFIQSVDSSPIEIKGIADFNLGIEYRYNSRVSAFIDFNNITSNRYHVWNLYPSQGFNMIAGATYAF